MKTSTTLKEKGYYVKIPISEASHAGFKAISDCEEIFKRFGFEPLDIAEKVFSEPPSLSKIRLSRRLSGILRRLIKLLNYVVRGLLSSQYTNKTVIYQVFSDKYDPIFAAVLRLLFVKGKRVLVLHDFNTLLRGTWKDRMRDRFVLQNFTDVIVHTEQMKSFVLDKMNFKGKVHVLGFYDYLITQSNFGPDLKNLSGDFQKKFKIAYAGTLTEERCGFLYDLQEKSKGELNYELHLYGDLRVTNLPHFVRWDGVYKPDDLPSVLRERDICFGLIWGGKSAEKIQGGLGRYLRYGVSHKASLYIVSGLPIICWSHSAIARLVEFYDVGFAVDSLLELHQVLAKITSEDYFRWKMNTFKLAQKLSNGQNLSELLTRILST